LKIIHIAGTKGKGSTGAFCESILRNQGMKTGLFTSPHLIEVRERIRIGGKPLDRQKFGEYFFDCWKRVESSPETSPSNIMPNYFRFLTLMAFHVFLEENVDVAIIEVGIGGYNDPTNFVPIPYVCGITSLGYDHTNILGTSLADIAWHKAGIFKVSSSYLIRILRSYGGQAKEEMSLFFTSSLCYP
jgi:folylpolyglutamate synthase